VLHIAYYWGGQHTAIKGDDIHKKFLIFVYPYIKDGKYYGHSELREVFNLWLAKQNILKWRNSYIQNYGAPIANIKYDADTTNADEVDSVKEMIANLQEQTYFTNPSIRDSEGKLQPKFDIEFIDVTKGGSATTNIHESAINQLDTMIRRKLLLPDELGFSETKTGSLAKAETQFELMLSVILYYHGRLEEMANKEIIPQLVDYNFPGVTKYPEWKFQKIDNKLRGDLLQILIQNGVVAASEPWIREYVNIPEAPEDVSNKTKKELGKLNIPNQGVASMPANAPGRVPTTTSHQGYDFPEQNTPHNISPVAGQIDNTGPGSQYPVNVGAYGSAKDHTGGNIGPIPGGMAKTDDGHGPAPTPMWRTFKRKSIHDVYDFDAHRKDLDKNEADFLKEYTEICKEMSEGFVRQIQRKKIIENKDMKAFNTISIPKGDMKKLLTQYLSKMYLLGKANAIDQNKSRLKKARPQAFTRKYLFTIDETEDGIDWLDREWIDNYMKEYGELGILTKEDKDFLKKLHDKAFFITGEEETRMLKVFHIIDDGINTGLQARDIISAIESKLSEDRQKYALTIARTNGSDSYNTGCMNLYMSDEVRPGIEAFLFSAIMDDVTSDICRDLDGKVIYKDDPNLGQYVPPVHFNAVVEGTRIKTSEGEKKIELVVKGDRVLTHENNFMEVYDTMSKFEDKEYLEIELDDGKTINITAEHPVFTVRGWIPAGELNMNDDIVTEEDIHNG
jgi:SPP1 gp7 family putative phage head morphogenesis protein